MALNRNNRRSARPWWLVVLVAVAGWAWQKFNAPQTSNTSRPTSQRTPSTRTPPERTSSNRPTAKPSSNTPPGMSEGGGEILTDTVVSVYDGDTVKLQRTGSVRLIGVDTPEKAQEGGKESTAWAQQMLNGKTVGIELCAKQPTDRYGRALGFIYLSDKNGNRVLFNRELVRNGYARVYSLRPCTIDDTSWNADYETARRQKRGLFATLGEVPDAATWRRDRRK